MKFSNYRIEVNYVEFLLKSLVEMSLDYFIFITTN